MGLWWFVDLNLTDNILALTPQSKHLRTKIMYKNVVVGFGVREMWLDANQQWPQSRKDRFLLKPDVYKPLSVDSYIWYSIFSEVYDPDLWSSLSRAAKYLGSEWSEVFIEGKKLSKPDAYRPRRVWRNLAHLREYLDKMWGNAWKPCALVAVSEFITEDEIDEPVLSDPIVPDEIDPAWQFLGYDVADYELYTGLFEGEINSNEVQSLRNEWGQYLNEHHLFIDLQKAFDYISIANKRYPSHMPYGVYGLYLVEEHNVR